MTATVSIFHSQEFTLTSPYFTFPFSGPAQAGIEKYTLNQPNNSTLRVCSSDIRFNLVNYEWGVKCRSAQHPNLDCNVNIAGPRGWQFTSCRASIQAREDNQRIGASGATATALLARSINNSTS